MKRSRNFKFQLSLTNSSSSSPHDERSEKSEQQRSDKKLTFKKLRMGIALTNRDALVMILFLLVIIIKMFSDRKHGG